MNTENSLADSTLGESPLDLSQSQTEFQGEFPSQDAETETAETGEVAELSLKGQPNESIVLDQSYYPNSNLLSGGNAGNAGNGQESTDQDQDDEITPSATSSKLPIQTEDEQSLSQSFLIPSTSDYGNDSSTEQFFTPMEAFPNMDPSASDSNNNNIDIATVTKSEANPVTFVTKSETLSGTPLLRNEIIKVGTHDGRFHADEVMGVTLLKIMYEYLGHKIQLFRTRDQLLLDQCDIVLDVGQVYDPSQRRFDHHQKSCSETFTEDNEGKEGQEGKDKILLSSAGMAWKEFGKIIVELYCTHENRGMVDATIIEEAYNQIYHSVVKEIDAHDNGQSMIFERLDKPELYRFRKHLDLGNTVSKLNNAPLWSKGKPISEKVEENKASEGKEKFEGEEKSEADKEALRKEASEAKNKQFVLATQYMEASLRIHFDSIIDDIIKISKELPLLTQAYNERKHPQILDVPEHTSSDPKLIARVDKNCELLYSVYYQSHSKVWGFATLQKPNQTFVNRKDLLSMETLKEILTPEEFNQVVFVHKNLFCGAAKNHDLAVKICELSATCSTVSAATGSASSTCSTTSVLATGTAASSTTTVATPVATSNAFYGSGIDSQNLVIVSTLLAVFVVTVVGVSKFFTRD